MSNTILIPTDLSIASLNTLKIALERDYETPPNVVLMYSEYLSDSISDLLFYSHSKLLKARISDSFKEALEIINNKFKHKIDSINIKCYHGLNNQALNNFLIANQVSQIFIPQNYRLKTLGKSFNPIDMLKASSVPIAIVNWDVKNSQSDQEQLISLFN